MSYLDRHLVIATPADFSGSFYKKYPISRATQDKDILQQGVTRCVVTPLMIYNNAQMIMATITVIILRSQFINASFFRIKVAFLF